MPERRAQLSDGKSKTLFETDDPGVLIQHYKDDATAFNGVKKGTIVDKGVFNMGISSRIFRMLEAHGIPTHLIEDVSERDQLVTRVQVVPVEFVVRNVAAGSLCRRYGIEEGKVLPRPMLEWFVKDDDLGDPLIGREAILILGLCDAETLDEASAYTMKVNELLVQFFGKLGITLVDFKIEFGRDKDGRLLLVDEITPDGCRLWDSETGEKMDKDRFRKDLGKVEETYAKVAELVAGATA